MSFGIRTPDPKKITASKLFADALREEQTVELMETERAGPSTAADEQTNKVRLSIGEIEARAAASPPSLPTKCASQPEGAPKPKATLPLPAAKPGLHKGRAATAANAEKSPRAAQSYSSRTAEAKACLVKAKLNIGNSRNLKNEIKIEVLEAVERLYILVREAENDKAAPNSEKQTEIQKKELCAKTENETVKKIEEHSRLLKENSEEMSKLTELIKKQQEEGSRSSYASVTAGSPSKRLSQASTAMHSIIIASKDEQETGDQVFERIRKVVNAKEEGVRIDRIRRAKDRKIIVGCRNQEEIRKVRERISEKEGQLSVEEIKNKDPLVILYGVLQTNTDDDIIKAIRMQNRHILKDVTGEDDRIEIRFRRRARNPLTSHVVAKVSPRMWQCMTDAGAVHIDMQRIRVADQSPLIQCSRCLGYGHGRRFCKDAVDVCSHCGGAHLKTDCPDWLTDTLPSCTNCVKAKMGRVDHNAFSSECPVRRKWEALARSTVAYC